MNFGNTKANKYKQTFYPNARDELSFSSVVLANGGFNNKHKQ